MKSEKSSSLSPPFVHFQEKTKKMEHLEAKKTVTQLK